MTFDKVSPMRHHLFTLGCFGAAITLYVLGEQHHAGLLIAAGGLSELLGWKRLLSRKGRS
ncbi:hypothetical protein GCM10027317_22110 [Massilia agri]